MLQELVANKWPCNIRELEHTIERSMLLTNGKITTNLHLSKPIASETIHVVIEEFRPKSLADNEIELIIRFGERMVLQRCFIFYLLRLKQKSLLLSMRY